MDGLLRIPDLVDTRKHRKINILVSITGVDIHCRMDIGDNLGRHGFQHHETTGQDGVIGRVIIDKEDIIP